VPFGWSASSTFSHEWRRFEVPSPVRARADCWRHPGYALSQAPGFSAEKSIGPTSIQFYSLRSACIGSKRAARRAGIQLAASSLFRGDFYFTLNTTNCFFSSGTVTSAPSAVSLAFDPMTPENVEQPSRVVIFRLIFRLRGWSESFSAIR
jgi:hypothetical protein